MSEGTIVHVSSTAAQVGSSDPVYAGTKAAVTGFVKSMAKALAPKIRVNCVAPGVTESGMTKNMNPDRLDQLISLSLLKKIAEPADIANGIYFLASDESRHITGSCLDINGGYVLR
jgi:NAD(P)-dependent dehydrogenase (short-subunit alcohol dehydrogenase family)